MNIAERDADIIKSRIALETLASIGERHGITRENVRQRWEKTATKQDRRDLKKAEADRAEKRRAERAKPEKVPMTRIHVLVPGAANLDPDQVVAALDKWTREPPVKPPFTPRGGDRLDLYLPVELKRTITELCAHHGVTLSDAVRYAASKSARNPK